KETIERDRSGFGRLSPPWKPVGLGVSPGWPKREEQPALIIVHRHPTVLVQAPGFLPVRDPLEEVTISRRSIELRDGRELLVRDLEALVRHYGDHSLFWGGGPCCGFLRP